MVWQVGVLVQHPTLTGAILHYRPVDPPYGWRPATAVLPEFCSVVEAKVAGRSAVYERFGFEVGELSMIWSGLVKEDFWFLYSAQARSEDLIVEEAHSGNDAWLGLDEMATLSAIAGKYRRNLICKNAWRQDPGLNLLWRLAFEQPPVQDWLARLAVSVSA